MEAEEDWHISSLNIVVENSDSSLFHGVYIKTVCLYLTSHNRKFPKASELSYFKIFKQISRNFVLNATLSGVTLLS